VKLCMPLRVQIARQSTSEQNPNVSQRIIGFVSALKGIESHPLESLMRVAIIDRPGASFRLAEVETPTPRQGEVLVKILASGLNPLDAKIRAGVAPHAAHPFPAVLGIDFAGVVAGIGPGAGGFRVGDEVYGAACGVGGIRGSLAEYVTVDARLIALKPRNLSLRQAAAMPLVVITAWEGLVDRAGLRSGQRVLVQGGAGGVGHVAIQIAKARGAKVFATASNSNKSLVERLGATAIDYRLLSVDAYVDRHTDGEGFDIVFDTVGGEVLDSSFIAVRRSGHVVSALGWGTHSLAPLSRKAASYSGIFTLLPMLSGAGREHHGEILRKATALAEAGHLEPNLTSSRFSLESIEEAYSALTSSATGKIVIDIVSTAGPSAAAA
jgi:NADPH:quinone reductase